MEANILSGLIVGAAIEVHRHLGPGLLESAYENCLFHELKLQDVKCERQVYLPLSYKGEEIGRGYRLDLLAENLIIVEIKAISKLSLFTKLNC
jgi:GxxExxY protein